MLNVVQAELTKDTHLIGKMKPYVVVKCGNSEFQSDYVKMDKSPVWN